MVFVTLAASLQHEEDPAFASQMVQTLNLILLTSTEAWELRVMLKQEPYSTTASSREDSLLCDPLPSVGAQSSCSIICLPISASP